MPQYHDRNRSRPAFRDKSALLLYVVAQFTSRMGLTGTAVESREGNVYCGNCQDFIYDPELEIRRLQKGLRILDPS
jgi:hypothetical protein